MLHIIMTPPGQQEGVSQSDHAIRVEDSWSLGQEFPKINIQSVVEIWATEGERELIRSIFGGAFDGPSIPLARPYQKSGTNGFRELLSYSAQNRQIRVWWSGEIARTILLNVREFADSNG